jgi:arsenate reductase
MAEGLINHYLGESWQAYSAGTEPSGYVHPLAVKAMAELDIDISEGVSTSVDSFRTTRFDQVITVCDDANEKCPLWLAPGIVTHIGFIDPAKATGTDAQKMNVFRRVRDEIRSEVLAYLSHYGSEHL